MRGFLVLIVVLGAALFGFYQWVPEFKAWTDTKLVELKITEPAAPAESLSTTAETLPPSDTADASASAPVEAPQ